MSSQGYSVVATLNEVTKKINLYNSIQITGAIDRTLVSLSDFDETQDLSAILEALVLMVTAGVRGGMLTDAEYNSLHSKIKQARNMTIWQSSASEVYFQMILRLLQERGNTIEYSKSMVATTEPNRLIRFYKFMQEIIDEFRNPTAIAEIMRKTGNFILASVELQEEDALSRAHEYLDLAKVLGYCEDGDIEEYKRKCLDATGRGGEYLDTHFFR